MAIKEFKGTPDEVAHYLKGNITALQALCAILIQDLQSRTGLDIMTSAVAAAAQAQASAEDHLGPSYRQGFEDCLEGISQGVAKERK